MVGTADVSFGIEADGTLTRTFAPGCAGHYGADNATAPPLRGVSGGVAIGSSTTAPPLRGDGGGAHEATDVPEALTSDGLRAQFRVAIERAMALQATGDAAGEAAAIAEAGLISDQLNAKVARTIRDARRDRRDKGYG